MTATNALPFAGTPEELEKYLLEFARLTGGWCARHKEGWVVSGGALLSTNPNTMGWRIRLSRREEGLQLEPQVRTLPWTHPKAGRIAAYRTGQLADYLTARVRGSAPEKFDPRRLREPFTPFGESVAARTASFAWAVLASLAVFAGAYAATLLVSMPLLAVFIRDIAAHSAALQQAGAIPLPSPAEAAATGVFGAAAVFAFPVAFFAALVHSAALAGCDMTVRGARLPQASFLFLTVLIGLAFYPFLSALALLLAPVVPLAAHLGATLVAARRRERVREGPGARKAAVLVAVILAASLAGAVVPQFRSWKDNLLPIALFRDSWLLGNSIGKGIASAYYRYTLYSAEPVKELYSMDGSRSARSQPIAVCADPAVAHRLRALHFTVTAQGTGDVVVGPGGLAPGKDLAELKAALDEQSRRSFRAGSLRELSSLSWHAVFYAGPLVALVVFMGIFAPFISILFRRLQPKTAVFALSALAMVTSLVLVLGAEERPTGAAAAVSADDFDDARVGHRHEAAVRATMMDSTASIADALLKVADDKDFRVRIWAVAALGKSGDPRALAKLVERLDDPEIFVRYRAAQGLELLKDPKAVEPLQRVMRERGWYEGLYALEALRAIRPGHF